MNKDKKPLSETHPELAMQAHGWNPTEFLSGSNKKVEWICSKSHTWVTSVNDRVHYKTNCPFCGNQKLLPGFNDLATTHPDLAKQAHGWDPTTVFAGTHKKLSWQCPKGHVWNATGNDRVNKNSGCSVCRNYSVSKNFNDLATTHPDLAKQAHGWDPTTVFAGTHKKLSWQCPKGHVWKTTGINRVKGNNCPFCLNKKLLPGFNDLATTHPDLAKQAHGWDPKELLTGSNKKVKWICSEKHIWVNSSNSRIYYKTKCPFCSNRKLISGFNDLATTHPDLAKQAHGWDPTVVYAGSETKLSWKCKEGHVWISNVKNRSSNKSGCPFCSNKKLLPGFNDLATTHPDLAKQAHGWDPKELLTGSNKKVEWMCEKGHKWKTNTSSRISQSSGCPSCHIGGFDPNKDSYIYLLMHPKWEMYQIGITNHPENRLKSHKRNGFELLQLRGPIDGQTAQELETAMLRFLKSQKADLSPAHIAGKFDGYSESWTIDSFQINSLKELIDRTREAGF